MKPYFNTKTTFIYCLCIAFTFGISACMDKNEEEPSKKVAIKSSTQINISRLNEQLASKFDSLATAPFFVAEGDTIDKLGIFKDVYTNKTSFWFNEEGINALAGELLQTLHGLQNDGLDIQHYRYDELVSLSKEIQSNATEQNIFSFETKITDAFLTSIREMLLGAKINTNKEIKNSNDSLVREVDILKLALKNNSILDAFQLLRPQHPWYNKFRQEYIRLAKLKIEGGVPLVSALKDSMILGDSLPQIATLRKRLFKEIHLPKDTISNLWQQDILESLKRYQFLNQLKTTGRLDTSTIKKLNTSIDAKLKMLALNMERMRWLKHDFKQPYIWVDIPKMEMEYYEKDSITFNMRVVVGRPSRATPSLDANILNVVLSPPWNVPPTIMREEVVPGIARRGGAYLSRRGLRAYDRRGRAVSASQINASNYRNFSIGQAPGYRSSLGEVKFNMPNPWAIYMHDTPHREDFVKAYRAYSSGCVRVHKPKEFATFLLRDSTNYSYAKIDSICKLRKTIFVPVKRNIDVHFVYLTTAIDSVGDVMYLKDIYGWD